MDAVLSAIRLRIDRVCDDHEVADHTDDRDPMAPLVNADQRRAPLHRIGPDEGPRGGDIRARMGGGRQTQASNSHNHLVIVRALIGGPAQGPNGPLRDPHTEDPAAIHDGCGSAAPSLRLVSHRLTGAPEGT